MVKIGWERLYGGSMGERQYGREREYEEVSSAF